MKQTVEQLILSRLEMQSTQRALWANYGITSYSLQYLKSTKFYEKYNQFDSLKKKNFLTTLAGPFNWKRAGELIEKYQTKLA